MNISKRTVLFGTLGLLTAANLTYSRTRPSGDLPLLTVGAEISGFLRSLDGAPVELADCRVAFVIHPSCPACNRLGELYRDRAESEDQLWMSVVAEGAEEFTANYGIDPRNVVLLAPQDARRVGGVPTFLVLEGRTVSKLFFGLRTADSSVAPEGATC